MLWVLVVIQSLQRLLHQLALTRPAAAALPPYIISLYGGTLLHRSIEQTTKFSYNNNHYMWLYNLIFVAGLKAQSGRWVTVHGSAFTCLRAMSVR